MGNKPRIPQFIMNMDEDEYRDALKEIHWSDHAIEMEVKRFNAWRQKRGIIKPAAVEEKEPVTLVEKIAKRAKRARGSRE